MDSIPPTSPLRPSSRTAGPGAAATASNGASIRTVIEQFPDLPREALLKEDLLRLGIAFSPAALALSGDRKAKSYFIFSFDRVPIDGMAQREHARVPEEIALTGGPWNLRRTIVSVRVNPASPYRIEGRPAAAAGCSQDGGLDAVLSLAGSPIADVRFPEAPAYYAQRLSGGRPITAVAPSIEWGYLIYLTVFRRCQYSGGDAECRFCDINENYRQQRAAGRPYVTVKSVDEVVEAMSVIERLDSESRAYTITGGAVTGKLRGLGEGEFYARYAAAIERRFPGRWISKVVTQALPEEDLLRLRDCGVSIVHPNYEVWDARLFEKLCPGKARTIGRRRWLERIETAAKVFGPERVIPNFVAGVELSRPDGFTSVEEALASTSEGLEHFMCRGIVPRFTTWCAEPLSQLGADQGPAPLTYHAGLLRAWRETHRRHGLPVPPGYGPAGAGRAVFSVSAFMDVIDPGTEVANVAQGQVEQAATGAAPADQRGPR